MKNIKKKDCCGCGACSNICSKKAITMTEDAEGFLYPKVDDNLCNRCNACLTVCPFYNPNEPKLEKSQIYCAKNTNLTQRINSSSGGIFPIIASWALKNNYFVIGVGFDKDWLTEHQVISSETELSRLCRSKYVQSNKKNIYSEVKMMLKGGKKVLFSGTPCECLALRLFLKKKFDNLICVDVICHGVPSPKVWNNYLIEKSASFEEHKEDIIDVQFKIKDKSKGYEWRRPGFSIKWKSGKVYSTFGNKTSYENGFLGNLFVRQSCHNCKVKGISSASDMTIGDYWGCNEVKPQFEDSNGVSLVFVNTEQGRIIYSHIRDLIESQVLTTQEAIFHNNRIVSSSQAHINRKKFFDNLDGNLDIVVPRMLKTSWIQKKIIRIKNIISNHFHFL